MQARKELFILIIVFLCGLSGFSIYRYLEMRNDLGWQKKRLASLKDKNVVITQRLEKQITQAVRLSQEKKALQDEIKISRQKLGQLRTELTGSRQELASLQRTIEELDNTNRVLKKKQDSLRTRINELSDEKDALLTKMNSIEKLKIIIRDLKRTKRTQPKRQGLVEGKIGEGRNKKQGNRGFVIYRGKSTHRSGVSIQVMPAD